MIKSRKELDKYIRMDAKAIGRKTIRPKIFGDECWKFQLAMRKTEYYFNTRENIISRFLFYINKYIYHHYVVKLGFSISINCIGPGLCIPHFGTIVINDKVRIGENCRIHVCVNIGEDKQGKVPTIGNNVYIGPGVKMYGDIRIADNVIIGANSVINKSIEKENVLVAGVPGRIIRELER